MSITTTDKQQQLLLDQIAALRARSATELAGTIITVSSPKGGQGKTVLAKELAWLLGAVLVDLDWDGGRVSTLLGYPAHKRVNAPLLDALALDDGKAPTLHRGHHRPPLVPGHPDLVALEPAPEHLAELLVGWAQQWCLPVVVDTHPGGCSSTLGAITAADLTLMPLILGTGELDAVEETLPALDNVPVLLVPNRAPAPHRLPAREATRLRDLVHRHTAVLADTFIPNYPWLARRPSRTVITATTRPGADKTRFLHVISTLAQEVALYAR